ncbi:nucleobindin-2-like isoform X1 [Ctenocephalides felis]|uniref:nucleobindin-2-like isoform X1 n=1 Tax=Ctenocephalides felis TaxID=7515 RepID=UPI000E6E4FE7|nr:nucleobindin-2-like isoform X1 [Ctenocephalides felis]
MNLLPLLVVISLVALQYTTCAPVTTKKPGEAPNDANNQDAQEGDLSEYMEYHRYLQEVVQALESDPEFREKLTKAEEVDIRTGKIAHELEYVNHNVRTKLDELKRQELERLRHLATKQFELTNDIDTEHLKIKEHLDHTNEHTFEVEDLKKLILKTTADLAEADKKRRQEFKEYEMQKEFEKQEKLKSLDEEHRKEYEKELKDQEEKHKKHEPLHHPGSKQQLEEVWEKQDHMENQNFDPRTFFMLHDLDGNGVWDENENEVKALFLKELDKLYQQGAPEDDMRERAEEMERMREHVFAEADTNRDGLISYKEFFDQTKREEFQRDQGWDTLETQKIYTHEEYQEFEKRRQEEIQRMIQQGMLPPNPYGHPGQMPPNGQFPPQGHPNYQNMHPNQVHQAQMNEIYNQAQHGVPPQPPPHGNAIPNQQINQQNQQFINQQNQQVHNQQNQQFNNQLNQQNQQVNHQQNQQFNNQLNQQLNNQQNQQYNNQNQQLNNQQNQQINSNQINQQQNNQHVNTQQQNISQGSKQVGQGNQIPQVQQQPGADHVASVNLNNNIPHKSGEIQNSV